MVWYPGQKVFGDRYMIERKLGEGGIGITYLARNEANQLRAIKTLKPDILNNPAWRTHQTKLKNDFRDEAVRLAVCRHPHIVQIENIFDADDFPCMVMEYIEGEDLGKRLQRLGVIPESEALLYMHQIGDALRVIHAKGLLHRDIKPSNIMVRRGIREAVLIDFGIAREFIPNSVQKHTVYRTPGFAPPEQYELEAPRGECIDVYALAATLYSLLTGVMPTSAEDRRRNQQLPSPKSLNSSITDSTNQAVMQGMALQAKYRPQTIHEWLKLLDTNLDTNTEENENSLSAPPTLIIAPTPPPKINTRERSPIPGASSQSSDISFFELSQNPPSPQTEINSSPQWCCVSTFKAHKSMIHTVSISPDGEFIASGSSDRTIKLWQTSNSKFVRSFGRWFSGHTSMVRQVTFSPNGEILASASWDETVKLWQVSSGKEIRTLKAHSSGVNAVTFSPDGQLLATGSDDNSIKLWWTESGRELKKFNGHTDSVQAIAFSPDGQLIASTSADWTVKLWQVSTAREIYTFTEHSLFVNAVAFSPNSQLLASASSDNTIRIWQLSTGKKNHILVGHTDAVCAIAFSPNGELLISSSWDKTIKIWETHTGRELITLTGHTNYIRTIALSIGNSIHPHTSNQLILVSGSDDTTIKIWKYQ
ncbi:MAG: serine/threonine-protein kinase [Cyanobacteria bacterium P01_A01_bin.84]